MIWDGEKIGQITFCQGSRLNLADHSGTICSGFSCYQSEKSTVVRQSSFTLPHIFVLIHSLFLSSFSPFSQFWCHNMKLFICYTICSLGGQHGALVLSTFLLSSPGLSALNNILCCDTSCHFLESGSCEDSKPGSTHYAIKISRILFNNWTLHYTLSN